MNASSAPAVPTLVFIPDITGFTQFVNDTEITHSRHIIEELLEALIDANELGLEISEIEGDAILFYREGAAPIAAALLAQVQRMYVRFHAHLRRYDTLRICECGACCSASGLNLKFVAHYGDVGRNKIKSHSKLFGRDVIVAHRLLKNDVPDREYVLFTHALIDACATWADVSNASWAEPEEGVGQYDTGTVAYCYIPLKPLRVHVPEPTVQDYGLQGPRTKVMQLDTLIEAPMDTVFDVLADLSSRHMWQADLKGSDRLSHRIPQHGASHRCVIKNSERDPFVVSHDFKADENLITFTDTERRMGWSSIYFLRPVGPGTTRLEEHMFLRKNAFVELLFRLFVRPSLLRKSAESYQRLNAYCKDLVRDGRPHPNRIVLRPPEPPAAAQP